MKKKSGNATIHRIELSEGRYSTISNNVLKNPNLTEPAKVLLTLMLNNASNWKIVLVYYQKMLGWSKNKLADAVENLRVNGYFKKESGGKKHYIISEFGNLNVEDAQPTVTGSDTTPLPNQSESFKSEEEYVTFWVKRINSVLVGIEEVEVHDAVFKHYNQLYWDKKLTDADIEIEAIEEVVIKALIGSYLPIIDDKIAKFPRATKAQADDIMNKGVRFLFTAVYQRKAINKTSFGGTMLGIANRITEPKRQYREVED